MSVPPPQNPYPSYESAPHDTQAILVNNSYPATGAIYPSGQHPRVKALLNLTLISGAIFAIAQILSMFAADAINIPLVEANTEVTDSSAQASINFSPLISLIILVAIYFTVYSLLKKGKNSGRVTGIVFCILGLVAAFLNVFSFLIYEMPWGIIFTVLYLAVLIVNIFWLIRAFHADVKANLH